MKITDKQARILATYITRLSKTIHIYHEGTKFGIVGLNDINLEEMLEEHLRGFELESK